MTTQGTSNFVFARAVIPASVMPASVMPVRAIHPVGKRGVAFAGLHRAPKVFQRAVEAEKTVEAARLLVEKANEGSPSVAEFRLRAVALASQSDKVTVAEPKIPLLLVDKWVAVQIGTLCTKIASRFNKDDAALREALKLSAQKAYEKAARAKAEERHDEFKRLTLKELVTHEVYLILIGVTRPGHDRIIHPHHTVLAASAA